MIESPAEVWCSKCDQPSAVVINDEPYCASHGLEEQWKRTSPSWAGAYGSGLRDRTHQHVIIRFTDGRRAEFVARTITAALDWAATVGPVATWTNQVTREPLTREEDRMPAPGPNGPRLSTLTWLAEHSADPASRVQATVELYYRGMLTLDEVVAKVGGQLDPQWLADQRVALVAASHAWELRQSPEYRGQPVAPKASDEERARAEVSESAGWCDSHDGEFTGEYILIAEGGSIPDRIVCLECLDGLGADPNVERLIDLAEMGVGHLCADHGEVRSLPGASEPVVVCEACGAVLQDVPVQGRWAAENARIAALPVCEHCEFRVDGDMAEHVQQVCPVARFRRASDDHLEGGRPMA